MCRFFPPNANPGLRHVPACPGAVCCGKLVLPVKQMTDAVSKWGKPWASLSPKSEQSFIFRGMFGVCRSKKNLKSSRYRCRVASPRARSLVNRRKRNSRHWWGVINSCLSLCARRFQLRFFYYFIFFYSFIFTHEYLHNGKLFFGAALFVANLFRSRAASLPALYVIATVCTCPWDRTGCLWCWDVRRQTASMSHPEAHTQILWAAAFPFPNITALSWDHTTFCFMPFCSRFVLFSFISNLFYN